MPSHKSPALRTHAERSSTDDADERGATAPPSAAPSDDTVADGALAGSAGEPTDDHRTVDDHYATDDRAPHSEDVHVRNYDVERAYRLDLTLRPVDGDGDGDVRSRTYRLGPGEFRSEVDDVPAGEYDVTAELDTGRTASARCRIGAGPHRMVLVEVGNWNVSVTEGVY